MNFGDFKDMSIIELNSKLDEFRGKLFRLVFKNKVMNIKNNMEIRFLRRDIARILFLVNKTKQ